MCDEVAQCRAAIDDVQELLKRKASKQPAFDWQREFESCVSELVKQNAGWE